tara:strand:+ start:430 stop:825 length:396 start_codon:yes stop_codon:yes gene_type:complete
MTEVELNKVIWLYQEAYQQLVIKYVNIYSSGSIPVKLKNDLWIIKSLLRICNRYQESEIEDSEATLNYITPTKLKKFLVILNCYFNKYNIKYKLKDSNQVTDLNILPLDGILTEGGVFILTEDSEYLLIES